MSDKRNLWRGEPVADLPKDKLLEIIDYCYRDMEEKAKRITELEMQRIDLIFYKGTKRSFFKRLFNA
jgi:hypothetical protein